MSDSLKLINPPTTEVVYLSVGKYLAILFAIIGGAIFANFAIDATLTAKSPKSAFFGFSDTNFISFELNISLVILPNSLFFTASSIAFNVSLRTNSLNIVSLAYIVMILL